MKKRIISALLLTATFSTAMLYGCTGGVPDESTSSDTESTFTDTQSTEETTDASTGEPTEPVITDEEPVFYDKLERDPIDPSTLDFTGTDWSSTITNANAVANGVQGKFADAGRKRFLIRNMNASLLYDLSSAGNILVAGLYNSNGKPYLEKSMDAYIRLDNGAVFSSAYSSNNARMNSHRIGYYYYDFRFCDQIFVNAEELKSAEDNEDFYDILSTVKRGWTGHDVTKIKYTDNVLSYTVKSSEDPYIHTQLTFSTEEYNAVQITLRTDSASSGNIYIAAGSHKDFNAEQNTAFRFNSGEWQTVVVPLSAIPDYTGSVTAFRIDCGTESGERVEISEIKAIKRGSSAVPFALERIYHTYSDKMHEVLRIVATDDYAGGGVFETQAVIPADAVRRLVIKNIYGETSELDGFDFSTTEYVGFDVKGVGVYGIIMPNTENNGYISVKLEDGNYIITRGIALGAVKKGGDVKFGQRIYTTESHQFNDLRKQAYIERNPLTDVYVVKSEDSAKYAGYDPLAGYYRFTVAASDFNRAYYRTPDKHYKINTVICGDGVVDRTVYLQTAEGGGMLESAAILDENNSMLPLPIEVGKNFKGEYEEKLFDPDDTAYGEAYVPITVGKDESKRFTTVHLYQNWGNLPLKQLSFIAFHISYYHLSVGVTETNCIAPYFVYGKDGWTLPDFRANSAPLWSGQPQHTSAGRLYFLQYTDADGNKNKSESQRADIASAGPVYADINMEYLSDDGKIKAEYRHVEMPQTDETRTYYSVKFTVLENISFNDFKKDFSIFTFDGRSVLYSKVGYLDENGNSVVENVTNGDRIIKLGNDFPYYDYFGGDVDDSVNFALIVINSNIIIGGSKYDGGFVFRDRCDGTLNYGSLSLDMGAVTLKAGDVIEIDMILLPWGYSTSKDDSNVTGVREDSCISPYKLTPVVGEAVEDVFIPSVKAIDNKAVFKLSGGKNNVSVRVYGFTDRTAPKISFRSDGADTDMSISSDHGYDGYQVYYDKDGTYSFSFAFNTDSANEFEITVTQ